MFFGRPSRHSVLNSSLDEYYSRLVEQILRVVGVHATSNIVHGCLHECLRVCACVCVCVSLQVQFVDYGSERIVDLSHLYVLMPQFCRLNRQGIRCQLAVADETGSAVEMAASAVSRPSLEAVLLNKLIVIKVMSMSDEDTCCVLLPQCDHNQLQIPQLARSDIRSSYIMATFIYSVGSVQQTVPAADSSASTV